MPELVSAFRTHLRRQHQSWTRPRELIANAVQELGSHFTAQELFDLIRRRHPEVGRVTVYRTLSLLVASGLVAERDFVRDRKHYEIVSGRVHHEHMLCLGCEQIVEFVAPEIERLQASIAKRHGFTLVDHIHKLFGYCQACQSAGRADGTVPSPDGTVPSPDGTVPSPRSHLGGR